MEEMPEIVKCAYNDSVTDIGQLSQQEKRDLAKWTRKGVLWKTVNLYWYGNKAMWVRNPASQTKNPGE